MNLAHKIPRYLFTCLLSFSFIFGTTNFAISEETYVFERMWPTLQQPWYFSYPSGIIADRNGSIYIADNFNHRIQKFTSDGQFIASWGNRGDGDGEFLNPNVITIDSRGFVYVGDSRYIQKFTSDGQFIAKWGGLGSGDGQFATINGLAIDGSDNLYVSDKSNHRIQKFTPDGQFITKWGAEGSGDGQFDEPSGIAVDSSGFVYVADGGNDRIQKFTLDGQFVTKWGNSGSTNSEGGLFNRPGGIAVDNDGFVYVADTNNHRIQKFTSDGQFIVKWGMYWSSYAGSTVNGDGRFDRPHSIALGKNGYLYITDKYNHRIQKFTSDGQFITKWACSGVNGGQFSEPQAIVADSNDTLYVADYQNHRIQLFTTNGNFISMFGEFGALDGQFMWPYDLDIDNNGYLYVSDYLNRIQKFTPDGQFITEWGSTGNGDGQFNQPESIAADDDGFVYVADTGNHRIQKFTSDGQFVAKWGDQGDGDGQFDTPTKIAIDSSGHIYVIDSHNWRIQKFTSDGQFITVWGICCYPGAKFEVPNDISVDSNDNVYISELWTGRIQKFTSDGELISTISEFGSNPGQLSQPRGMYIGKNGLIYVADARNHRVQIFKFFDISKGLSKAIIVAGGGTYPSNNLWDATQMSANFVYRTLTYQGFTKQTIYYLTTHPDLDLDNNGEFDDVDGDAKNSNLQDAITNWASDADSLLIYMVNHGGNGSFRMSGTETLSASDLDAWLDQIQETIPGKVIVIYDACESGSFLSFLTPAEGKERTVITSTSAGESAYFASQGSISFSNYFWTHVFNGESIKNAFDLALQAIQVTTDYQHPSLEADGDGIANETDDFNLVENKYIGNGTVIYGDAPVIGSVFDPVIINNTTTCLLTVSDVTDDDGIARVWAVIRPPDYNQGSSDNPVQELPSVDLMPVGNDQYEILYDGFNIEGTYQISVYTKDRIGNTSIPKLSTVTVNNPLTRKAIIVAGSKRSDILWPAIEKNAKLAVEALSFQGYSNKDIYLMSPASIPGVTIPTVLSKLSNLEYALTEWASDQTQDVVVYLIGNGGYTSFEMNETEILSAMDLDMWLDTLQDQIPGKVVFIQDANQSGTFIPLLTPPAAKERILISSTNANEPAHFISSGDISFSKFFWRQVLNGTNIKDSFIHAKNAMQYCQGQAPILDDNGNGIGNEKEDGQVARLYTLGVGIMLAGDDPVIGSVSPGQTLYGTISAALWAENITTTGTIDKVWAVISPPGNPNTELSSLGLVYDEVSGKYEGTYNNFSLYGTYSIAVYAMDTDGNVSLPSTTSVTQEIGPDIYEDDNILAHAGVITLDDTEAQTHNFHDAGDQDWIKFYASAGETYVIKTYNLGQDCDTTIDLYNTNGTKVIPTKDDYGNGGMEVISWQCQVDGIYYVMVKQYNPATFGLNTNYDLRVYHPTAAWPGKVLGRVADVSGNGIEGALVWPNMVNTAALTLPNGYYLLFLPPGTYTMTVTADGFEMQRRSGVAVTDLNAAGLNFTMSKSVDIDGDGKSDIADAILTLQALVGFESSGGVRSDYASSGIDVNGDDRVGLEEVIYILQKISEVR